MQSFSRSSSPVMIVVVGAGALSLMGGAAQAAGPALSAPAVISAPRPAVMPLRPAAPMSQPMPHVRPVLPPARVQPAVLGARHGHSRPWHGRRFINAGLGVPLPYGVYPSGWVEPQTAAAEPSSDTSYGYPRYAVPTPCVPPTIIVIGEGMKGAVAPTGTRDDGSCTTPRVIRQTRVVRGRY